MVTLGIFKMDLAMRQMGPFVQTPLGDNWKFRTHSGLSKLKVRNYQVELSQSKPNILQGAENVSQTVTPTQPVFINHMTLTFSDCANNIWYLPPWSGQPIILDSSSKGFLQTLCESVIWKNTVTTAGGKGNPLSVLQGRVVSANIRSFGFHSFRFILRRSSSTLHLHWTCVYLFITTQRLFAFSNRFIAQKYGLTLNTRNECLDNGKDLP